MEKHTPGLGVCICGARARVCVFLIAVSVGGKRGRGARRITHNASVARLRCQNEMLAEKII